MARYLDLISAGSYAELADLYAEDAVVEHPFNPAERRLTTGRETLRQHFAHLQAMGLQMTAEDITIHTTGDPETVVAEFAYRGTREPGGHPVSRRNVFVVTVRDGLIASSRDYQGDG